VVGVHPDDVAVRHAIRPAVRDRFPTRRSDRILVDWPVLVRPDRVSQSDRGLLARACPTESRVSERQGLLARAHSSGTRVSERQEGAGPARPRPVAHGQRPPRTTKRPKELVGGPANRFVPAPNKSGVVTLRPGTLARWPCDHRTRFPDPSRGSLPGAAWRFAPAPSGKTKCTGRGRRATTALSTNFAGIAPGLSPSFPRMWMACGRATLQHPRNIRET
jgi:hypothetical protein